MKSSPANAQLFLPPTEVAASEQAAGPLRKTATSVEPTPGPEASFRSSEHDTARLGKAEQLAATFLNQALEEAGLTNKEVAHLCGVSASLVEKWRSTEARGGPSFVQLLLLPPAFHFELHRAMNRRYGFGRQLLARILDDLGALALAVGE